MQRESVSACLIIIGNEILSGRTQDANLAWLARALGELGIPLREARVVPDDEAEIIAAVNACRARYTYVFTTGGIGPTHDDITSACIAKAFGLPFGRHPEAERRLLAYYPPERVNPERMSMADTPEGAQLIDNPVSVAPGFRVENVYVLPGVPKIMQAMMALILPTLKGGKRLAARTITLLAAEGDVSRGLREIQAAHPATEIGSYPFWRPGGPSCSIVIRGTDPDAIDRAAAALLALAREMGIAAEEDGAR